MRLAIFCFYGWFIMALFFTMNTLLGTYIPIWGEDKKVIDSFFALRILLNFLIPGFIFIFLYGGIYLIEKLDKI